ncbi:von Willebrand factor D and EGF domain-containing protein-like isoform X2 [Ostrea edulis]|uniref:von Willebrand factor D and EGF domain-containing protein-like isoform X2 n=1 Tax=Ostrea edulis TaxID=37623 RepID=UPI00209552E8|nr:von Willebrand factor D and EGF domain-containing protein-like isoform X2 [Ostrea edulis]
MCGQYVLYLMLVNGFTLVAITVTQDPCQTGNHQELGDALKRSPDYAMDATPICDRYLLEGWYTAPSRVMPRSAPGLGFCNTLYPYWMKGTPPAEVGQEIDVEICGVGFSSCDKSFTVKVKRCPSFLVYRLLPLDSCNSAYCFENTGNCVSETPTGIEVVYHGVSYTSKTDGGVIQHEPVINLLCRFTPLLDSTLFYHVDWYVNKTRVLENQTVDSTALDKAVFSTQDLYVAGEKLGCSIHCIVGAKKTIAESPCNSSSSALFYAGIEVLTPVLNMSRKGQTTLRIRPTIPYASQTLEFQNQNEKLEISQPLYINLEFPSTIQSACVVDGTSPNLCEMKLPSFKYSERHKYGNTSLWYKEYAMTVYNRDDLGYAIQNSMILRLKTGGQGANAATVFEQTALPDIPINIHDDSTEWKGRYCYSRGDPHMRTFDGYKYECHHVGCETGITMVLYENKVHDQEVQVRHHKCIYPNARCIYTLAVRSGNDVFIIDIRNNTKYINFPICEDKSLKVVKASDRRYKVTKWGGP